MQAHDTGILNELLLSVSAGQAIVSGLLLQDQQWLVVAIHLRLHTASLAHPVCALTFVLSALGSSIHVPHTLELRRIGRGFGDFDFELGRDPDWLGSGRLVALNLGVIAPGGLRAVVEGVGGLGL